MITGEKIIPMTTINTPAVENNKNREKNTAESLECPSFSRALEKEGTKAMLNMPSEKSFLARSKGLKAMKKASLWEDVPKTMAISASLTTPSTRLAKVKPVMIAVFLSIFLTSFP
jgi:hypothetical protein